MVLAGGVTLPSRLKGNRRKGMGRMLMWALVYWWLIPIAAMALIMGVSITLVAVYMLPPSFRASIVGAVAGGFAFQTLASYTERR